MFANVKRLLLTGERLRTIRDSLFGTLTLHSYSSTGSASTSKSAGGSKKFKAQFPSGLTASFAGNNSSSSKGLSAGAGQQKVPAHSGPIPDTAEPEDGVAFGGYVSSDTDEGLIGNSDSDASESTNQVCFAQHFPYIFSYLLLL